MTISCVPQTIVQTSGEIGHCTIKVKWVAWGETKLDSVYPAGAAIDASLVISIKLFIISKTRSSLFERV